MDCYACDREATSECPRCGALFCDEHGEALCARCSDPALALPSYRVYRGSLIALLAGTLFAVWLLVRPPAAGDSDSPVPPTLAGVIPTATPTAAPADETPVATPTPATTPSPTPSPTAEPTPEPTVAPAVDPAVREHTVADGESLFLIAELYLAAGKEVLTFVDEIAALNGLSDPNEIFVGQVVKVPLQ